MSRTLHIDVMSIVVRETSFSEFFFNFTLMLLISVECLFGEYHVLHSLVKTLTSPLKTTTIENTTYDEMEQTSFLRKVL